MYDETHNQDTLPIPSGQIAETVALRDAALAKIEEAARSLRSAYGLAQDAAQLSRAAAMGASCPLADRTASGHYDRLFGKSFDAERSVAVFLSDMDANIWTHLINHTGMNQLMDRTAHEDFQKALLDGVPEISEDNIRATLERLFSDRDLIFKRGLATAFSRLDRRFRSHDGFKIGSRVILTRAFDDWGSWNHHSHHRETLTDIERVFAVLDGETPNGRGLIAEIDASRGRGLDPRQSECVSDYFTIRGFMNGNIHLWFNRDDLLEKANQLLAEFYGEVIGDAMEAEAVSEDLTHRSGLPARDLQFYPTPHGVIHHLMDDLPLRPSDRVLEPSAGTGNIASAVARRVGRVDCVEIHPARAAEIEQRGIANATVTVANFLGCTFDEVFDLVLMNPPFASTHWIDHVRHAFDALKPGGRLRAVLPVTAEIGDSSRHRAFRRWAKPYACNWGGLFRDLPPESFAESGTRIHTVILDLRKPLHRN